MFCRECVFCVVRGGERRGAWAVGSLSAVIFCLFAPLPPPSSPPPTLWPFILSLSRLDAVENLMSVRDVMLEARKELRWMPDIERLLSRCVLMGALHPLPLPLPPPSPHIT